MTHHGNICNINGADVEPVDIITFGSPCQDMSVAGKRAGIQDGERSNLFFEAVRIIKEIKKPMWSACLQIFLWNMYLRL